MEEDKLLAEDTIDLRQLWDALMRRKVTIALIVLAAVVTAYVGSRMATPIYESTTTLLIKGAERAPCPRHEWDAGAK